jgi:hypothetical protein
MREPKAKEMVLVFIGQFNPVIINPNWLAGKGLISEAEADAALKAEGFISHPDISQFKLSFCGIQTLQNKYTLSCTQEGYFDGVQEITTGIFTSLAETPIIQVGINTIYHYEFSNEDEWHNFGHILAPKEIWNKVCSKPGLKKLQILGQRDDDQVGEINIEVEQSPHFRFGTRIAVNDHYQLYSPEEQTKGKNINAKRALDVLATWKDATANAAKTISGVINYEK